MTRLTLAYADGDAKTARQVADGLSRLGIDVGLEAEDAAPSDTIVLLWSRRAAARARLKRVATAARERGALAIATLDDTPTPPSLRSDTLVPLRARAELPRAVRSLAALAEPAAAPAARSERKPAAIAASSPAETTTKRKGGGALWLILLLLVLLAGAGGAAFYLGLI